MTIFSKFKDYTEELEEILEKKYFSSQIKNLLLSMLYKLEISYNDFIRVKKVVREKDVFLEDILNVVSKYCDNLKIVKPDENQANLLEKHHVLAVTNEKERSALVYASEKSILYAIADIEPKYYYVSNKFVFKNALQRVLVNGYISNTIEVLSCFNGWSWDTNQKDVNDYISNLIYQNLLFMLGEDFLTDWRVYASSKRDFLTELRLTIKEVTGKNDYFDILCRILYKKSSKQDREKIDEIINMKIKELKRMNDKQKYLADCTAKKMKLTKTVEYIDRVLNDKDLIIKEFAKYNSKLEEKKQLKNIKGFCNLLENQRESYIEEIAECAFVLKPTNYIKRMNELKSFEEIYKSKTTIMEDIVELEKCFIRFLERRAKEAVEKEELINVIYALRYLKNINIDKKKNIKNIDLINIEIDRLVKKCVTKACKEGYIKILSMNIRENYDLINMILDTRIIRLEDIRVEADKKKKEFKDDKLHVVFNIYDKEVFEKQVDFDLENDKNLAVKNKKMVKLFY